MLEPWALSPGPEASLPSMVRTNEIAGHPRFMELIEAQLAWELCTNSQKTQRAIYDKRMTATMKLLQVSLPEQVLVLLVCGWMSDQVQC